LEFLIGEEEWRAFFFGGLYLKKRVEIRKPELNKKKRQKYNF